MKQTYDVFDTKEHKITMHDVVASEIEKALGVNSRLISKYSECGYKCKKRYLFTIVEESSRCEAHSLFCVYDMQEGEYKMSQVTIDEVSEKYGIKKATAEQYSSTYRTVKGRYLIFRAEKIPVHIILPIELQDDWNNTMKRIGRKRRG